MISSASEYKHIHGPNLRGLCQNVISVYSAHMIYILTYIYMYTQLSYIKCGHEGKNTIFFEQSSKAEKGQKKI